MKSKPLQLFFLLFLITFSLKRISDNVAVIVENEKYHLYEIAEINENQTENTLKTQFLEEITLLNNPLCFFKPKQENKTPYLFKFKEISFKNWTPPPENEALNLIIYRA